MTEREKLRATWNGRVLAESDDIVMVEGNAYFPVSSLDESYFEPSDHKSICAWKGQARYLTVVADGERNENAAWYYPDPLPAARRIAGRVAFWKGITAESSRQPVG